SCFAPFPLLPSFPTRRSSDLAIASVVMGIGLVCGHFARVGASVQRVSITGSTKCIRGFYLGLDRGCCQVSSFDWKGHLSYFPTLDRKSTRLNSSHDQISYAVF